MKKAKAERKGSDKDDHHKSKSKERHKKGQSRQKRKEKEFEDFDDDTLEALPKNLKPIWSFMDDKNEMVEQMFLALEPPSLQKMIPKILKDYNMQQVKDMCLEQLCLMSEDHILYILTGGDPDSFVEKQPPNESLSSMEEDSTGGQKRKSEAVPDLDDTQEKKRPSSDTKESCQGDPEDGASCDTLELHTGRDEMKCLDSKADEIAVANLLDNCGTTADLDLLELEMRAKAIRSLLKAKGLPSSSEEEEEGTKQ